MAVWVFSQFQGMLGIFVVCEWFRGFGVYVGVCNFLVFVGSFRFFQSVGGLVVLAVYMGAFDFR